MKRIKSNAFVLYIAQKFFLEINEFELSKETAREGATAPERAKEAVHRSVPPQESPGAGKTRIMRGWVFSVKCSVPDVTMLYVRA